MLAVFAVSILTGPEGPVLLQGSPRHKQICRFNPHRPRRAGATPAVKQQRGRGAGFQSSPAPKGRCYAGVVRFPPTYRVSILTGPEGPVLPQYRRSAGGRGVGFNPHRPRRAGATIMQGAALTTQQFQSSPAPKGRCYADQGVEIDFSDSFQSSPAPKGRCYCWG